MKHPWESVPLSDYENHMRLAHIQQLPILNRMMGEQLTAYRVQTAAILGVAGGNGLEHIAASRLQTVYGIDVNQDYLNRCRERFTTLGSRLVLLRMDLSAPSAALPEAELVLANLLVEYIGLPAFGRLLEKSRPRYVSCVIQQNFGEGFVSRSPYEAAFSGVSRLHTDISRESLTELLSGLGYSLLLEQAEPLPGQKQFLRLDFALKQTL